MTLEITNLEDLRATLAGWRAKGDTIALVPTMGALHEGHLALVAEAKRHASKVVVSIFVNPTQFGPNEDFHRYPRPIAADLEKLRSVRADAAWLPSVETMYPNGPVSTIHIDEPITQVMDGAARPGHFDGVATVVAALFEQVKPDLAIFGEKDYQQLLLIKRLVNKLELNINVIPLATQRENDGLARSSRNAYLTENERRVAPQLHAALQSAAADVRAGNSVEESISAKKGALAAIGFAVEYLDLRDAETLAALTHYQKPARLFVAAKLGTTRLIDNIPVE